MALIAFNSNTRSNIVNGLIDNVMTMAGISREFKANARVTRLPETQNERNQFRVEALKISEGKRLTSHPQYKFNPRHSNNPDAYIPARRHYQNYIQANAAMDRQNNPAWHRAQTLNSALNS